MEKVKNVNFTAEEKGQLQGISKEVFIEIPNVKYAKEIIGLLSIENLRSIANGHASMPQVDNKGVVIIQSSEPQGTFRTPGFGDPEYSGSFYQRSTSIQYVLDLPDNIGDMVGEGAVVISIETQGNWSFSPGP